MATPAIGQASGEMQPSKVAQQTQLSPEDRNQRLFQRWQKRFVYMSGLEGGGDERSEQDKKRDAEDCGRCEKWRNQLANNSKR